MSLRFRDKNGAEAILAGLTPGGDIEYGAVATRTGTTETITVEPNYFVVKTITFSEPMPDNDYLIELEIAQQTSLHTTVYAHYDNNKTANGFKIWICNPAGVEESVVIKWTAFKLYTVADAEALMSDVTNIKQVIPADASSSNKLVTNADLRSESRALDRRLDDVEDVVPNSASINNKLVTQSDLSNVTIDELGDIEDVELTDIADGQTLVWDEANSQWVNGQGGKVYTVGNGIDINENDEISARVNPAQFDFDAGRKMSINEDYKKTFVGTKAQWDALSASDKKKYVIANITDDITDSDTIDSVVDGNMKPITSNAVYDYPIDSISDGQHRPPTSNAVFDALSTLTGKVTFSEILNYSTGNSYIALTKGSSWQNFYKKDNLSTGWYLCSAMLYYYFGTENPGVTKGYGCEFSGQIKVPVGNGVLYGGDETLSSTGPSYSILNVYSLVHITQNNSSISMQTYIDGIPNTSNVINMHGKFNIVKINNI